MATFYPKDMIRRIKHTFLRLSPEEKVAVIGQLLVLIGAFLPWYEVNLSVDSRRVAETGFSGDMGVIGFAVFLITLLALGYVVSDHMRFRLPDFGYLKEKIVLFLMGQSAFLLLLTTGVYLKRSFDFTDAGLRFGIYTALIGAILSTLAAYALLQRLHKKEVQAFFGQEVPEEGPATEEALSEAEEEAIMDTAEEEAPATEEPEEEQMQIARWSDEEDEMTPPEEVTEEVAEEVTEEVAEEETEEVAEEETATENQADYFSREAGLSETEEEEASPPAKKPSNPSMNFYED